MTIQEVPHRPDDEERRGAKKLGLPNDDDYADAMLMMAGRAFDGERYHNARRILLGLVMARPNDARIYEAFGILYQAEGHAEAAARCFQEAVDVDADAPIANVNLGEIAWRRDRDAASARLHLERVANGEDPHLARRAKLTLDRLSPTPTRQ